MKVDCYFKRTISWNARQLENNISNFLNEIKAEKVTSLLIVGGLDMRNCKQSDLLLKYFHCQRCLHHIWVVLLLTSQLFKKTEADEKVNTENDPNGFAILRLTIWTWGQGPQLPGLNDLTIARASEAINLRLRGNISPTFTMGANADLNADNALTENESSGLFPSIAHRAEEHGEY